MDLYNFIKSIFNNMNLCDNNDINELNNKNSISSKIDFSKLSVGALIRYKCHFNLEVSVDNLTNKEFISDIVSQHFSNINIDPEEVIESFMAIEKDTSSHLNNTINSSANGNNHITRKSARNQEKAEKQTINKLLENFKSSSCL